MRTWTSMALALAVAAPIVAACESATEIDTNSHYGGALSGAKEKPTATTSTATGVATVVVTKGGSLSYAVTWTGLSGAAAMAHIHGPADSNNTAAVLIDFSALPPGSSNQAITLAAAGSATGTVNVQGSAVITATVSGDSLMKLLNAGQLYVNVHTAANTAGEIRAQLLKQ